VTFEAPKPSKDSLPIKVIMLRSKNEAWTKLDRKRLFLNIFQTGKEQKLKK